jgi:tetratricopeptide (TPR) repeat protein
MGDLHRGLGHGEQALEFHQKAFEIRDELYRRNPNSADFARDLWVSYCRMAQIEEHTGGGKALDCWRKAYAAISEMKQRGILLPTDEQYLETLAAKAHGSEPAHSLPAGSGQQSHRVQIHGYYSTPHPSANGAHAAQLNMEYQKARKAWEALPWLKRVRTPKPEPPTGI